MLAKFLRRLDAGFLGKRGWAVRRSSGSDVLYDVLNLAKDSDGYFCRVTVFIQDSYSDSGHMGLHLPEFALGRMGVSEMPDSYDETVEAGFLWSSAELSELVANFEIHAVDWFNRWANLEMLEQFFRYAAGQPVSDVDWFKKNFPAERLTPAIMHSLSIVLAHQGNFSEAFEWAERYSEAMPTLDCSRILDHLGQKRFDSDPSAFPFEDLLGPQKKSLRSKRE